MLRLRRTPFKSGEGYLLGGGTPPLTMLTVIGWILAIVVTLVPSYMIWRYAKRAVELDERIAACDPTLLTDDGLNISRLMAVPQGTQYLENAQIIMPSAAPMPIHSPVMGQTGEPNSDQ